MKIALLGPIAWRTPPRAYGPWEQVVSLLAEGLVERGVDVTLFATLDSQTKARLDGVCPQPYNESDDLDGKSVADLKKIAEQDGIDLGEATKKTDIIAAIRAHRATPAE